MSSPARLFALTALIAALASLGAADRRGGAAVARQTAVQAQGSEFRIGLSRTQIKPGRLRLEFINYGEDIHDLAIRKAGGKKVHNVGATKPGERSVGRYSVRRGSYLLWCTIADHRARGMRATLRVKR